jgi:hypothetical protein
MSDPKSSYGEPVDEPTSHDDVVGRANEGLADAEAARRDAVTPEELAAADASAPDASAPADTTPADAPVDTRAHEDRAWADEYSSLGGEPVESTPAASEPVAEPVVRDEPATTAYATEAATTAYATEPSGPAVTASEPADYTPGVAAGAAATTAYAAQPIFVQAPEAPQPRGNRAAAGAIGLLAAVSFGILYLAAWLGFGALNGDVAGDNVLTVTIDALGTWSFWVPIVVFYIGFWLLGAIINRGRWGAWVIFGLFVGVVSYLGHLLGALFQAPFWTLTPTQGLELVEGELLAPLAIAAFVIGRELTIWFGAWVAARGKRVTELNTEAQREYERTLEAGPQLVQQ